jgi:hypothetical protein
MAFMGLPWPTNSTGMRGEGLSACNADAVAALLRDVVMKAPGKAARPVRAAREVLRCMGEGA